MKINYHAGLKLTIVLRDVILLILSSFHRPLVVIATVKNLLQYAVLFSPTECFRWFLAVCIKFFIVSDETIEQRPGWIDHKIQRPHCVTLQIKAGCSEHSQRYPRSSSTSPSIESNHPAIPTKRVTTPALSSNIKIVGKNSRRMALQQRMVDDLTVGTTEINYHADISARKSVQSKLVRKLDETAKYKTSLHRIHVTIRCLKSMTASDQKKSRRAPKDQRLLICQMATSENPSLPLHMLMDRSKYSRRYLIKKLTKRAKSLTKLLVVAERKIQKSRVNERKLASAVSIKYSLSLRPLLNPIF